MYATLQELHSYIAFAVLGLLLIAALNAFAGLSAKRPFLKKDRQIALIALAFAHTQLVLGLTLLFTSPYFEAVKASGMGAAMKDSTLRLYVVEHPLTNIIALVIITIGWSAHKKATESSAKFKKIAYLYAIGLVLLLSRIPWSAWLN
ncbi:hypothetical protein E0W68_09830 [Flavobacterium salilacus subsp. salilacus]|uniref:hypothetical protein n=1 Tax=Flavobacterium TaxID=237 RepID=UPI001074C6BA|nr:MULTISPECIES: hypothetical protein [Flavobacterium]KAF2518311.1 hypothetical protein E0W68_09830 [Flavobacterium salilacus subsp. salilacus]MBE1615275.1 hypothetical protein [Flavobacterium sp. SaA2.13]